jgi:hypothetical protein
MTNNVTTKIETKERKETKEDKDLMNVLVTTHDLLNLPNLPNVLLTEIISYTRLPVLYVFGYDDYSGSYRLFHNGTMEGLPTMPISCYRCTATRHGDNIYVVGVSRKNTPSMQRFHIPTQTWSSLTPLIQTPRIPHTLLTFGDCLYIISGIDNMAYKSIEIYDIKMNVWTSGPSTITSMSRPCGLATNDKIYIFGGWCFNGRKNLNTVECFDTKSNSWTQLASMKYEHHGGSAVKIDANRMLVMGGYYGEAFTDIIEEYSPIENTWKTLSWKLPISTYGFASCYDPFHKTLHIAFGYMTDCRHYVRQLDNPLSEWITLPNYTGFETLYISCCT